MNELPAQFADRLRRIIPQNRFESVSKSFTNEKKISARINLLKTNRNEVCQILESKEIKYDVVPWSQDALVFSQTDKRSLGKLDLFKEGKLYFQGLSSILIPLVLDPKPNDEILDLCAAPGSKTAQMAAMMNNRGRIVANEPVKNRFFKLKSVCALLGVKNVVFKMIDGRRLRLDQQFDKILIDAPCSSEGRFYVKDKKSFGFWSLRKIKEMTRKQKGLLLNASRLLKQNGTLVYSTCTFAPEENEGGIDWVLKKAKGTLKVEPISIKDIQTYPCLSAWNKKTFDEQVKRCIRILPNDMMEGFFVAKLERKS